MHKGKHILAIDQGTSSTKSLIFDEGGNALAKGWQPLRSSYPEDGFVEQDPEDIWQNVLASVRKCLQEYGNKGFGAEELAAIGVSNQRETFVLWDAAGKPLYPAVVWQCKRSAGVCAQLRQQGLSSMVREKTGLVIDPYFSATKLIWLFQRHEGVKKAIQAGNAYFGTIDTWLLYKLTGGKVYATDYTNASRTLLFNLHTLNWDEQILSAFGLTGIRLPEIRPSSWSYGETRLDGLLKGPVPVTALAGDSHAAAFGEGCLEAGTAKATLGTGCSILMNIGRKPLLSANGMVTTVCWSMEGRIDFAYEGVIVSCGATLEWMKKELGLFKDAPDTESMALAVADNGGVYLVPAFSGLGSPYWQMDRRASVTGVSFSTTKNHIVRAALESIGYQIADVIAAMEKDASVSLQELSADGGITANGFVMQFTSDVLNRKVAATSMPDVSALGAALLAGLKGGVFESVDSLQSRKAGKRYYHPGDAAAVAECYAGWRKEIGSFRQKTPEPVKK
jgi:glycerol kinase